MKPHYYVSISAIICLSVLEVFAMYFGINGLMRSVIFSIIAAIAGISIPEDKLYKFIERMKGGNEHG